MDPIGVPARGDQALAGGHVPCLGDGKEEGWERKRFEKKNDGLVKIRRIFHYPDEFFFAGIRDREYIFEEQFGKTNSFLA